MTSWYLLIPIWAGAAVMMVFGWHWQRRHNNAGIVDVLWSTGLATSAVVIAAFSAGAAWPRVLVGALGGIWGARLARHLWVRVRGDTSEDGRYKALRARWGNSQWRWRAVFQLQAFLIPLFSVPFVIAASNPSPEPLCLVLAVVIWLTSVWGEHIADQQLARFRADPANHGKTCRAGLWRYSRHPNYFFEWVHWFTYVAISVGSPSAVYALWGPVLMYVFLRWLSGVPFTEAQALRTRGDDYREYQRRTSMFFPWPPRRA